MIFIPHLEAAYMKQDGLRNKMGQFLSGHHEKNKAGQFCESCTESFSYNVKTFAVILRNETF